MSATQFVYVLGYLLCVDSTEFLLTDSKKESITNTLFILEYTFVYSNQLLCNQYFHFDISFYASND